MRQRKDGTTFPVSVSVSPVNDEYGTTIGAASIARDITEQSQARTAAALATRNKDVELANQNLASFTYTVSHDLRSPLRALAGYSNVLLEECGDALGKDGRHYAERIEAASQQMATLIDDLLNLSRITRVAMHLDTVDLSAEVDDIAGQLQRREPGRDVHFRIQRLKRSLMVGVTEGCEVQAGAGEEAVKEPGPVLHPLEPGLHQGGELGQVAFGEVGQGSFQV